MGDFGIHQIVSNSQSIKVDSKTIIKIMFQFNYNDVIIKYKIS